LVLIQISKVGRVYDDGRDIGVLVRDSAVSEVVVTVGKP
jgi:hypothetical protein